MLGLLLALNLLGQPVAERIADIQVHGNTLTPDARIREIAGVDIGLALTPTTLVEIESRLKGAHLFEKVEVLKRFASIADPSQIALVIVVDEGRVEIFDDLAAVPGVRKRRGPNLMFVPLLSAEDGYGLTYGGQFAFPEPLGPASRISFPLTWGGDKRAAAEVEWPLSRGPLTRFQAGVAVSRREHPFFEANDDRRGVSVRGEREVVRRFRAGVNAAVERIVFLEDRERHVEVGVDAQFDTRVDPFLPGNAVYGRAEWTRLQFERSPDASRTELEGRGYIGLPRAGVIVLRALRQSSSAPLPLAMKPILGGSANLRGFRAGSAVGDNLVAGSAEIRMPINAVLSRARLGASAFVDVATAYAYGARLADQDPARGFGGGVWLVATVFRANLYVAHGVGGTTHLHFTVSTSF